MSHSRAFRLSKKPVSKTVDFHVTKQPCLSITILENCSVLPTCFHLACFVNTKELFRVNRHKNVKPWKKNPTKQITTTMAEVNDLLEKTAYWNLSNSLLRWNSFWRLCVRLCLFKHAFACFRWRVRPSLWMPAAALPLSKPRKQPFSEQSEPCLQDPSQTSHP